MNEKITFTDDDKRKLFDPFYDYSGEMAEKKYHDLKGRERFFVYTSIKNDDSVYEKGKAYSVENKEKYKNVIDADSESSLMQKVYKTLWDNKYLIPCMDGNTVKGDTLNSVNTTLNEFYRMNEKEIHKKERGTNHISKKYNVTRYAENKDNFNFLDCTGFDEFVELYHTIGNFMPVPCGCNGPRGKGTLRDYWDLTLLNIFRYYNKKDEEYIKKIIGEKKELVERYRKWLDDFGDWENFVNKNYLRAFVDDTLYPKELWNGHFDSASRGCVLPETLEQCEEYFKNAAECIKERTAHMLEALQVVL